MHLPALIEDQSEWPAHGQRHCSSVAIHYLLCRFGSFASFDEQVDLRKGPNTPNYNSLNRNLPQGLPKQLLSLKRLPPSSGKPPKGSQTFSIQVASKSWKNTKYYNILQQFTNIYNIWHDITRLHCQTQAQKIRFIFLYCVYPVRNAKIATTLNSVNVCVCACVCVSLLSNV